MKKIPVIDLFAGPGGLGEGFSQAGFDIKLSIEMDPTACETLRIRKFFHFFKDEDPNQDYYDFLSKKITLEKLKEKHLEFWKKASNCVLKAELGNNEHDKIIYKRLDDILKDEDEFILIGGPPCQAYSLAGRSRRLGTGYTETIEQETDEEFKKRKKELKKENSEIFYEDKRHTLFKEYLKIINRYNPKIFVMENVKGLGSAKSGIVYKNGSVFKNLTEGLKNPRKMLSEKNGKKYSLHSFVKSNRLSLDDDHAAASDFIIRCEDYGIPQKRHRIIIMGVREDVEIKPTKLTLSKKCYTVRDTISDMPKIRSGLSKIEDTNANWVSTIKNKYTSLLGGKENNDLKIPEIIKTIGSFSSDLSRGGEFVEDDKLINHLNDLAKELSDENICGWINHHSRSHIESDLIRYLFCSAFAIYHKKTPMMKDWEGNLEAIKPAHNNITKDKETGKLTATSHNDRFKVQVWDIPSSTIVSHISKDGHYYIHPDPEQCRSLTVREAARLQTFPDNYFFFGGRTAQYHQVGNAVPPLLAKNIALNIKKDFFEKK